MSQFRDLIARMAVDAEFARYARANPDAVSVQYGLTADERGKLRGLADAAAVGGPQALGARLSKSGIGTGGLINLIDPSDMGAGGHEISPLDSGGSGPHGAGSDGPDDGFGFEAGGGVFDGGDAGGSSGLSLPGGLAGGHSDPGVPLTLHGDGGGAGDGGGFGGTDQISIGPKPEDPSTGGFGGTDMVSMGPKHDDPSNPGGGADMVSMGPKHDDPSNPGGDPAGVVVQGGIIIQGGLTATGTGAPSDGGGDDDAGVIIQGGVVVQGGMTALGTGAPSDGGGDVAVADTGESAGIIIIDGRQGMGSGAASDGGEFAAGA
jgi:hypothetical protein